LASPFAACVFIALYTAGGKSVKKRGCCVSPANIPGAADGMSATDRSSAASTVIMAVGSIGCPTDPADAVCWACVGVLSWTMTASPTIPIPASPANRLHLWETDHFLLLMIGITMISSYG
jgi:hypothetical protein